MSHSDDVSAKRRADQDNAARVHVTELHYRNAVKVLLSRPSPATAAVLLAAHDPARWPLNLDVLTQLDNDGRFAALVVIRGRMTHRMSPAQLHPSFVAPMAQLEQEDRA